MNVAGAQRAQASTARDASDVLRLPHSAASVGMARRRIGHDLRALGLARALCEDVEVVVSELLGNAVRHARPIAGGALLVFWHAAGDGVTVKVTDGGSPGRVISHGGATLAEAGRGLQIVEGLAERWGVVDHVDGLRTVWAILRR